MSGVDEISAWLRPLSSRGDDIPVGRDDMGNTVYRTMTGSQYAIQKQYPQRPMPEVPASRRVTKWDAQGRAYHDSVPVERLKTYDTLKAAFAGLTNGLTAPARALSGEGVTYGDMLDTASMVQLGAAAMPAPRGALRSGAMRVADDAAETPAQMVARMLRDGQAADVTDDLMARADPSELHSLYVSGATGADMPMDTASRMARAQGMGFDTETTLYHGTPNADFQSFRNEYLGNNTMAKSANMAHFFSDDVFDANTYAASDILKRQAKDYGFKSTSTDFPADWPRVSSWDDAYRNGLGKPISRADYYDQLTTSQDYQGTLGTAAAVQKVNEPFLRGANVQSVIAKKPDASYTGKGASGDIKRLSKTLERSQKRKTPASVAKITDISDPAANFDPWSKVSGDRYAVVPESNHYAIFDPTSIRSRFARFDPRLSHLANLTAGATGLMMLPSIDRDEINAYLGGI